jgi:hypothetical protein
LRRSKSGASARRSRCLSHWSRPIRPVRTSSGRAKALSESYQAEPAALSYGQDHWALSSGSWTGTASFRVVTIVVRQRDGRTMKEIVTVYFQHVEKLRVAAALPLTATNSGGLVGTLQSKALPAGLSSTCLTTCGSLRLVCTATTLSSRVTCGASWRTFLQASSLQTEARRTSPWRPITHVAGKPINQGARPAVQASYVRAGSQSIVRIFGCPAFARCSYLATGPAQSPPALC